MKYTKEYLAILEKHLEEVKKKPKQNVNGFNNYERTYAITSIKYKIKQIKRVLEAEKSHV